MHNEMIETIEKYGIDSTAEMLAEYVNQKITSEDVAIQFILEELEAASLGNALAKQFAYSSGFDEDDYLGAMNNSFEEVDGAGGPQQTLLNYCSMLFSNMNLATELRIKTVDNIMKEWKLGKYAAIDNNLRLVDIVKKVNNLEKSIFANINNDLNESIKEDHDIMILMAYGYARRTIAAGLYLQGIFSRENYEKASNIFRLLQIQTGQSVEFQENAAEQASELLLSYDQRLNKELIATITTAAELDKVECAYDNNKYFSDEQIFEIFDSNSNDKIIKDKYGNKYREIRSPYTGRTWLDRNLGAKKVASSFDDEESYGYYYQWGRKSDGHELNEEITHELLDSELLNHNKFILSDENNRFDWNTRQDDNLWKGIQGINNPCPNGYRLPTREELADELIIYGSASNIYDAFNNFLKIPSAGCRGFNDGEIYYEGNRVYLWTSNTQEMYSTFVGFDKDDAYLRLSGRAGGASIRCIKD